MSDYLVRYASDVYANVPPKDGKYVFATIHIRKKFCKAYIRWDVTWGNGRGCWFDRNNHAVSDKAIVNWERRVPEAPHYQEVVKLNATGTQQ